MGNDECEWGYSRAVEIVRGVVDEAPEDFRGDAEAAVNVALDCEEWIPLEWRERLERAAQRWIDRGGAS